MTPEFIQQVVLGILGGGGVAGIFALVNKRSRSPESQNELARLGNEFAKQLLDDARSERKELRDTIKELEESNSAKQESIDRLNTIAENKDRRIAELERRQNLVAQKLQAGEKITLSDIFGGDSPAQIHIVMDEENEIA